MLDAHPEIDYGTPRRTSAQEVTLEIDGQQVTGDVPVTAPLRPGDTVVVRERFF